MRRYNVYKYIICVLIIAISSVVCCLYCLYLNKKEDKPEIIETPSYDEFCLKQYRSSVRCMCDCVQDNGEFGVYSSEYTVWQTGYKSANIKDIAIFITSTRNTYRPNEYDLVLQTSIPLEHLESLYTRITYRVIVLKKYKKEDIIMSKKELNLDDKDILISIRQYINYFIDYSEVGCNRQSYTDKIYEEEYQMDFQDLKSKKFANIIFDIRARFNDRDKYCIVMQLSKPFYDMYQKNDYVTIKLIVVDQKYNQVVKILKEVLGEQDQVETERNKAMDEKQKILNDIDEAQHKLDEARKKLDEYNTEYKRFRPKEGEYYYYVTETGRVMGSFNRLGINATLYNVYNCFKTREEAEAEADKILVRRQLEDIAKRLNKGKKINWENGAQLKYYFCLYKGNVYGAYNKLIRDLTRTKEQQGTVYCLDENFLDVAKREIGEDRLIKYIRGEG